MCDIYNVMTILYGISVVQSLLSEFEEEQKKFVREQQRVKGNVIITHNSTYWCNC